MAEVDFIGNKKFKKTTGYETDLTKLLDKAKKAKPGKELYEIKSKGDTMKFRAKGKKASPVNELDYSKIKDFKKTSPTEKAVAFTYPGPDEKNPLQLFSMRFPKEEDYSRFVDRVENPSEYTGGTPYTPPASEKPSPPPSVKPKYADGKGDSSDRDRDRDRHGRPHDSHRPRRSKDRDRHHRPHRRRSYTTTSSSTSSSSTTFSSSSSSLSTTSSLSSRYRKKSSKKHKKRSKSKTRVPADNVVSVYQKGRHSPILTVRTPYDTKCISTKPKHSRRANSARPIPTSTYSTWSSTSSSSTSSTSSSDIYTDEEYYEDSGRKYVISRCKRKPNSSGVKCRPVGEFKVTE